jgi:hypothetical protein
VARGRGRVSIPGERPLTDPVFSEDVVVDYGRDVRVLPIGRQFDALVLYPSVSVIRSLAK